MTAYQTLIFDLDGTLIDSAPAILASFRQAFDSAGIRPVRSIEADIIGPPLKETLEALSGSTDTDTIVRLTEAFKLAYDGGGLRETTAYDGVDRMLRDLHQAGVTLHIATNKRLYPTEQILRMLDWHGLFDTVYALDMVEPRLPGKAAMIKRQLQDLCIDRTRTAYIGDRREDGEAAKANALPFFAATWGYGALTPDALEPGWIHLPSPDAATLLGH